MNPLQIEARRAHHKAITEAFHRYDMEFDGQAFAAEVAEANAKLRLAIANTHSRRGDIKVPA